MTIKASSTAEGYGLYMRQRAKRLTPEILLAMRATGAVALSEARSFSSGALNKRMLRRMGHPYKRPPFGIGVIRPGVINVQTGEFRRSWKTRNWTSMGNTGEWGITVRLVNTSPHSRYMAGTRRMVHRPILKEIMKAVLPDQRKLVRTAVKRAVGPGYSSGGGAISGLSGAGAVSRAFLRGYRQTLLIP